MTDEQKELLRQKGISEEEFEECYISEDGQIFTPNKGKDGNVTMTAQEKYNELLKPPSQQPTIEYRIALMQKAIDDLTLGGAL